MEAISIIALKQFRKRLITIGREERTTKVEDPWVTECSRFPNSHVESLSSGISEELHKKDLYDPDNHDGVITHLEPDILEC